MNVKKIKAQAGAMAYALPAMLVFAVFLFYPFF